MAFKVVKGKPIKPTEIWHKPLEGEELKMIMPLAS